MLRVVLGCAALWLAAAACSGGPQSNVPARANSAVALSGQLADGWSVRVQSDAPTSNEEAITEALAGAPLTSEKFELPMTDPVTQARVTWDCFGDGGSLYDHHVTTCYPARMVKTTAYGITLTPVASSEPERSAGPQSQDRKSRPSGNAQLDDEPPARVSGVASVATKTFPAGGNSPTGMTSGPCPTAGQTCMWWTNQDSNSIGYIAPGGSPQTIDTSSVGTRPERITSGAGPCAAGTCIWWTNFGPTASPGGSTAYMNPDGTGLAKVALRKGHPPYSPIDLTLAPCKPVTCLWVTNWAQPQNILGTNTAKLSLTNFTSGGTSPAGITSGTCGTSACIWWTKRIDGGYIGRINADGSSKSKVSFSANGSLPAQITTGPCPEGSCVWWTNQATNTIGRVATDAPGGTTPKTLPAQGENPADIVSAPGPCSGGTCIWWTNTKANQVVYMNTDGTSATTIPLSGKGPNGIASGPCPDASMGTTCIWVANSGNATVEAVSIESAVSVVQTFDPEVPVAGSFANTLTVSETVQGAATLANVVVTDTMPAGVTITDVVSGKGQCSTSSSTVAQCRFGSAEPGATLDMKVTFAVDGSYAGTTLTSTVLSTATDALATTSSATATVKGLSVLANPKPEANAWFGTSVAASATTSAVGAHGTSQNGFATAGAAYVFNDISPTTLVDPSPEANAQFGFALQVNSDTVIVGKPQATVGDVYKAGKVLIYGRNQGGANAWGLVQEISNPAPQANDNFGFAVDIADDKMIVGKPFAAGDNRSIPGAGAVDIFTLNAATSTWILVKEIENPRPNEWAMFGFGVGIADGVAIVGAPADDKEKTNAGSVSIFAQNEGGQNAWGRSGYIANPEPDDSESFGWTVSITGPQAAVGTPYSDPDATGEVYILNRAGTGIWAISARVQNPTGAKQDHMGGSVAILGKTLAAGASQHNALGYANAGAGFTFGAKDPSDDDWIPLLSISPDPPAEGFAGWSVALTPDRLLLGAPFANDSGITDSGRAWSVPIGAVNNQP